MVLVNWPARTPCGTKRSVVTISWPAQTDAIRAFFESDVVPTLTARNGLRSIRGFVNRSTGTGMIGTVWTDEAAMEGSLDTIKELRAKGAELGMTFGDANLRELLFAQML